MEQAQVLAFRWRTSALARPSQWKRDSVLFAANETVGDLRRRLASLCGSSAELAADVDPELWQCDDDGVPAQREPVRPAVLLAWTPATCPRALLQPRANGEPQAVLLFTFPPAAPAVAPTASASAATAIVWRVNAEIKDAKRRKGVRGAVFVLGSECRAFYLPEGRAASVFHDGDHLHVELLFKSEEAAMSFQTALEKYVVQNPLLGLTNALHLDPRLHQQTLPPGTELLRVSLQDYKTADSDSPPWSLAAYAQSDSLGTPASVNPERLHQCLERPGNFSGLKLFRMHLKSQSDFPRLRGEENNVLYGSGPFHQYLDGLNTESGLPGLAIRSDGVAQDGAVDGRARVDVLVELRSDDEAAVVPHLLKERSTRLDDRLYRSFVYVTEPALFVECLTWKYEDTRRKWAAVDAALAAGVEDAPEDDDAGSIEGMED